MKLAVTALSAALLFSSAGLALAQAKGGNGPPQGQKSDDCVAGVTEGNDMAVNQSLRCRTEEKPGTVIDSNDADTTGSTTPAPQSNHNMNDVVPQSEQP